MMLTNIFQLNTMTLIYDITDISNVGVRRVFIIITATGPITPPLLPAMLFHEWTSKNIFHLIQIHYFLLCSMQSKFEISKLI